MSNFLLDFKAEFYFNMVNGGIFENDEKNLKLEADFGNIFYNNTAFNIYEINFKSPSEHTVGELNTSFPLEMQIFSISEVFKRVSLSILFRLEIENNFFLEKLGLGK